MGGCLSTSSESAYSGRSNGDSTSPFCFGLRMSARKRTRQTFSHHVDSVQDLSSIPNRVFSNGTSRSSCIFTQQGRKGINQDAMIVWEDFIAEHTIFCGVFDGHGPYGHLVARMVRDTLPSKLMAFLSTGELNQNGSSAASCNGDVRSGVVDPENEDNCTEDKVDLPWREAFLKSYKAMDKDLRSDPSLDSICSGSTAVTIVKQGSNLFMGYIGDSRAVLGSKDSSDAMEAIQLTVDLKPDLPREAERIKRCKGRVFALEDEPEVQRVWLPFDDAPGLAMARAFGDFCLKEYGVISIPEFSHRVLTDRDKFIVLASDGVWDVLSNQEVVDIVASAPSRSSAARIIVDSAAREWKSKYPTSKMDDCAVVCLFLDGKMDAESDCDEQCLSSATLQSNHSDDANETNDFKNSEPLLQRNFTVRPSEDSEIYKGLPVDIDGSQEMVVPEDQNWSGLEGVTRVNSLVQLPRFSQDDSKP
ncbi:hypothetical protein Leryth_007083 [Lithospermum erythrorhizon]|nr:hypothetical protein Leryth_007083 [Lithospermum erythrorhizon]